MIYEALDITSVHEDYGACHYNHIDQEMLFQKYGIDDGAGSS